MSQREPTIELKIYFVGKIVEQAEICALPWGRFAPVEFSRVTCRYVLTRPKSFIVQLPICSPRKIALPPGYPPSFCVLRSSYSSFLFMEFHLLPLPIFHFRTVINTFVNFVSYYLYYKLALKKFEVSSNTMHVKISPLRKKRILKVKIGRRDRINSWLIANVIHHVVRISSSSDF